ncbi:hypothetical protein I532_01695 [Brevibacillus borstelensis AK1]|uniref:Uncharacterized protein n=1 Tax=Brevibacillus borstelensis AK1 TaxID=1300222 RepID=M8DD86_9BACL|nr:hypothetical protein [Brevibacillus borstelensis]EMT54279.1 hypothetical protein I532_01695 [Brevibacillus borstelensis AK1]
MNKIIKSISALNKHFEIGSVDCKDDLFAIEEWISKYLTRKDFDSLTQIRDELEKFVDDKEEADLKSYVVGRATGMLNIIYLIMHLHENETLIDNKLSNREKKFIEVLGRYKSIKPTDIMRILCISNKQYVSNILADLRSKELISYDTIGKNRLYYLSFKGDKVFKELFSKKYAEPGFVDIFTPIMKNSGTNDFSPQVLYFKYSKLEKSKELSREKLRIRGTFIKTKMESVDQENLRDFILRGYPNERTNPVRQLLVH